MAVVDAAFLVAAWNEDDPSHPETLRKLHEAPVKLRVNAGSLAEASRVIRRVAKDLGKDGNQESRTFLDAFLNLPGAAIDASGAEDAWRLFVANTSLSFTDAWILAQARAAHDEVWTFDKGLAKEARRRA